MLTNDIWVVCVSYLGYKDLNNLTTVSKSNNRIITSPDFDLRIWWSACRYLWCNWLIYCHVKKLSSEKWYDLDENISNNEQDELQTDMDNTDISNGMRIDIEKLRKDCYHKESELLRLYYYNEELSTCKLSKEDHLLSDWNKMVKWMDHNLDKFRNVKSGFREQCRKMLALYSPILSAINTVTDEVWLLDQHLPNVDGLSTACKWFINRQCEPYNDYGCLDRFFNCFELHDVYGRDDLEIMLSVAFDVHDEEDITRCYHQIRPFFLFFRNIFNAARDGHHVCLHWTSRIGFEPNSIVRKRCLETHKENQGHRMEFQIDAQFCSFHLPPTGVTGQLCSQRCTSVGPFNGDSSGQATRYLYLLIEGYAFDCDPWFSTNFLSIFSHLAKELVKSQNNTVNTSYMFDCSISGFHSDELRPFQCGICLTWLLPMNRQRHHFLSKEQLLVDICCNDCFQNLPENKISVNYNYPVKVAIDSLPSRCNTKRLESSISVGSVCGRYKVINRYPNNESTFK